MLFGRRGFAVLALYMLALNPALHTVPAAAASEHDQLAIGPAVGAKLPHDLSTVDQDGKHRDFKTLAHSRGLVILFTRSVDW